MTLRQTPVLNQKLQQLMDLEDAERTGTATTTTAPAPTAPASAPAAQKSADDDRGLIDGRVDTVASGVKRAPDPAVSHTCETWKPRPGPGTRWCPVSRP